MATQMGVTDNHAVRIDRIISRAFATIRGNPLVIFGITLVFAGIPSVLINLFTRQYRANLPLTAHTPGTALAMAGYGVVTMIAGIAVLLLYILAQGAIVRATIDEAEGRHATFADCALTGLRAALPLIGLNILFGLGAGVATLFFVIPGIFLYVMWSVSNPALVAERIGVFAAFSRSRYLTSGARWKVFGVELISIVFVWLISASLGVIALAVEGVAGFAAMSRTGMPIWYLLLSAILQTIVIAFWGTLQTSLYIELRDWKDGPAGSALADVFS